MDKDKYPLVGYGKDNPIGPTTGGAGGTSVTVSTPEDLQAAVEGDSPQIVYLDGTFNLTGSLQVGSNKSLLGLGRGAEIINNGISVDSKTNVIIRNLRIGYIVGGDAIGVTNSTRLWIDHNELASDISRGPDFYVWPSFFLSALAWITDWRLWGYIGRPDRYCQSIRLDYGLLELPPRSLEGQCFDELSTKIGYFFMLLTRNSRPLWVTTTVFAMSISAICTLRTTITSGRTRVLAVLVNISLLYMDP